MRLAPLCLAVACAGTASLTGDPARFHRIDNQSDVDLALVDADDAWQLTCDDPADPDRIRVDVVDDTLRVRGVDGETGEGCTLRVQVGPTREILVGGDGDLTVRRPLRALTYLEARGSGEIALLGGVKTPQLTVEVLGNGAVHVAGIDTRDLFVEVAGRGDVLLSGRSERGDVLVRGIGNLTAVDLQFRNLYVELLGAGRAVVFVTGTLDGVVRGEGNLEVYGDPDGDVTVEGDGRVVHHGEGTPQG